MTAQAVSVEQISKRYRIGDATRPASTIRDAIAHSVSSAWRRVLGREPKARREESTIWALKDVSFSVNEGEVLGLIGKNGAGKSTLLKILSRITEPTGGRAVVRGRVASLLEVGTGFQGDLTGRENVHLNGSIMGMTRREIRQRFDEIVAFSEVEKFIDTPVKHYSSGMYMRLAFAVAAHLEPEVLIVDEVLAVGDFAFQKKCLGKMGEVSRTGRTVLFVSHNLPAVGLLCARSVLLAGGRVAQVGATQAVIETYLRSGQSERAERTWDETSAPGNERVRIIAVRVASGGTVMRDVATGRGADIEIDFRVLRPGLTTCVSIHLLDQMGVDVLASGNFPSGCPVPDPLWNLPLQAGVYRSRCTLPPNFLNEGHYSVNAFVLSDISRIEAVANDAVSFHTFDSGEMRGEYSGPWLGVVRPRLPWRTDVVSTTAGATP